jgi:4-hydroxy-tetrahydrodipicolinate synthase
MIDLSPTALRGSFPPLVTPFLADGTVDHASYARLAEMQADQGSHGLVVTGTTGEPSTLTSKERIKLLNTAIDAVGGRLQVVASVGSQDHASTIEMVQAASSAGADALLIVTPYFIRPPERGLEAYYIDLCARTDLPVMIYHIPGRAAVGMTADSIARVADRVPNLVGIKHAVNDLGLVTDLRVKLGSEFRIHVGLEELSFPMLCVGADGLMNAVGNLAPRKVAALYEAVAKGQLEEGRRLHFDLYELNKAVFYDTNPIPIKYMMMRMGLIPNELHRLPMVSSTAALRACLNAVLENAGLATDQPLRHQEID